MLKEYKRTIRNMFDQHKDMKHFKRTKTDRWMTQESQFKRLVSVRRTVDEKSGWNDMGNGNFHEKPHQKNTSCGEQ